MAESTAIAGYNGKVYISDDGGSTYTEVAQLQDVTLNITVDMLDSSTHATAAAGWKQKKPGMLDWSADCGALIAADDAANDAIFAALTGRTAVTFRFDPEGEGSTKPRYSGTGYIKDWKETSPTSELAKLSVTMEGNGPLTREAQTGVTVSVAPATATVSHTGPATQAFTATVAGSGTTTVTWQVVGGTRNGTIAADGVYTAPAAVPTPATVTVIATSLADSTVSDTAVVTVS